MILKNILKNKTVSVWGLGYLGYTTILKLHEAGFNIVAYDLNKKQLDAFRSGNYPSKDQIAIWSRSGYLPKVDYGRIKVASSPKELFAKSYLHVIAIPMSHTDSLDRNIAVRLAEIFSKNMRNSRIDPLIIFESASVPGNIEKNFIEVLDKDGLKAARDYYLGGLYRADWNIESFLRQTDHVPMGGCCDKSIEALREITEYMGIPVIELGNMKEAEIYANSMNTIQAMTSDFARQLALGYPRVNVKRICDALFRHITLEECALNIGTGGKRMTMAIDNLIDGSDSPQSLTLLKEFQDINVSSVLSYGEYIVRHGYKEVTILGITYKGNQKDLTLSPSITLADYLSKNGVRVRLNDPFCSKQEISRLVKGAVAVDFPEDAFSSDVLVVASDHNLYKYLTQSETDKLRKKPKLIVDNYAIWSGLSFGEAVNYHCVGDGKLDLLK